MSREKFKRTTRLRDVLAIGADLHPSAAPFTLGLRRLFLAHLPPSQPACTGEKYYFRWKRLLKREPRFHPLPTAKRPVDLTTTTLRARTTVTISIPRCLPSGRGGRGGQGELGSRVQRDLVLENGTLSVETHRIPHFSRSFFRPRRLHRRELYLNFTTP